MRLEAARPRLDCVASPALQGEPARPRTSRPSQRRDAVCSRRSHLVRQCESVARGSPAPTRIAAHLPPPFASPFSASRPSARPKGLQSRLSSQRSAVAARRCAGPSRSAPARRRGPRGCSARLRASRQRPSLRSQCSACVRLYRSSDQSTVPDPCVATSHRRGEQPRGNALVRPSSRGALPRPAALRDASRHEVDTRQDCRARHLRTRSLFAVLFSLCGVVTD